MRAGVVSDWGTGTGAAEDAGSSPQVQRADTAPFSIICSNPTLYVSQALTVSAARTLAGDGRHTLFRKSCVGRV